LPEEEAYVWQKRLLPTLSLVCAAGLFALWLSSASRAVEAQATKSREAYVKGRCAEGWRCVVLNGVEGKEYHGIDDTSQLFSPNFDRLGFAAERDGKWFVVVDGVEGKEYDSIGRGSPSFSPDNKRVGYGASRGGKWFVVVDGVEGKEYDGIAAGSPAFSPDSKRVAYFAIRRTVTRGRAKDKWFVVVDGVEGKKCDNTRHLPQFSVDNKYAVYVGQRGGKWFLFSTDGVEETTVMPIQP
jgi:hypothetical protein